MIIKFSKFIILTLICTLFSGCVESDIFEDAPLNTVNLVFPNPFALAVNSAGTRLYLCNSNHRVAFENASFMVFDISDKLNPVAFHAIQIPNFCGPKMILDEVRGQIYLPLRGATLTSDINDLDDVREDDDNVLLLVPIDEARSDFLATRRIPSVKDPVGIFQFGDDTLFVAARDEILRYDLNQFGLAAEQIGFTSVDIKDLKSTNSDVGTIDSENLAGVAVDPSEQFVVFTNGTDPLGIIDLAAFPAPTQAGKIDLGAEPVDYIIGGTNATGAIERCGTFLCITEKLPATLRIFDVSGLPPVVGKPAAISLGSVEVGVVPVDLAPEFLLVDEASSRAFVSNTFGDTISIVDLNAQLEIKRLVVGVVEGNPDFDEGQQPTGAALFGEFLFVANLIGNNIAIFDLNLDEEVFPVRRIP